MKVALLTFEQYHGRRNIGSSMIRCHWLLPYWSEAEIYKIGQKYSCIIFQKVYWPEYAKMFKGIKILDICDPDFFYWGTKTKEMIIECDVIVCGTKKLARHVVQFSGDKEIWVIPDRVNLKAFPKQKIHKGEAKIVAWFGYSDNFEALKSAIPALDKLKLKLIVVSNKVFVLPPNFRDKIEMQNFPWATDTWQNDLLNADIIINPKLSGGKWDYKSNNKTLISWALGLPVATNENDLKSLLSEEARKEEVKKNTIELHEKWQVQKSVKEYKKLIRQIYAKKKGKNFKKI